jgi:DnaJ domain
MNAIWGKLREIAHQASRVLPPCHVCGAPGAQVCRECGKVGCPHHAYSNVSSVASVCSKCMAEKFPWAKEDLVGPASADWPYPSEPWEILGVDATANAEEIKLAHRSVSQQCHPDHGGSDEQQTATNRARDEMLRRCMA